MADIALTCRLHKKPGKHVIRVNTGDTVDSLIGEVKQVFGCNEARDIVLWKTEMPNESEDAFTNLILAEGDNLIRLTAGELTRFWGEGRPLEDHTHIIVDSPILEKNAELRSKDNEIDKLRGELELYLDENASDYIITDNSHSGEGYLKDLFYAKIIRINDVLRIKKRYKNKNTYVNVHIQCKVTNFDDGMLSVMLIDRNEEQEKGFFSLAQLEKWLVEHSLDAEDIHVPYEHSGDNIEIIRNERLLGSIRMRRNCYIYNQKNRKDSAKLESKQDADLSETLSRLSITETENQAEKLGDREVIPIKDIKFFKELLDISDALRETYTNIPFACVSPGIVDDSVVLIALVDTPENTPVDLPAKFGKYPVLIDYGAFDPAHRSYHETLSPGISISDSEDYNACTIGALFKTEQIPGKKYILTVEHGVGYLNDKIIQPGGMDEGTNEHICAKVIRCDFDLNNGFLIDYAFCEVYNRDISVPINIPFESGIVIDKCKKDVYDNDAIYNVQKVGRTTYHTYGFLRDKLTEVKITGYPNIVYALTVYGCDTEGFGQQGDSGAPVFDNNGVLWGILQGTRRPNAVVIPIHVILDHAEKKFGIKFELINTTSI